MPTGLRLLAGLGTLAVLGCATPSVDAAPSTRYRGDLDGLERVRDWSWQLDELYERPGVELARYERVWVEPVALAPDLDTDDERYRDSELASVQRLFHQALVRALEDAHELVDGSGAGVLRVRTTLLALRANRPPFDRGRDSPTQILSTSRGVGRAAMQLELIDGGDGGLLLVAVDRYQGHDFRSNLNTTSVWGDARHAFRRWAAGLRDRLTRDPAS